VSDRIKTHELWFRSKLILVAKQKRNSGMAKHEAANMNLSKSVFELSNQLCYSAVPFLLENIIGLSQEGAVSL